MIDRSLTVDPHLQVVYFVDEIDVGIVNHLPPALATDLDDRWTRLTLGLG